MTMQISDVHSARRRRFLLGAAAAAVAPALAFGHEAEPGPCTWCLPGKAAWKNLAERTDGQLLLPGQAGFLRLASPQNLRYRRVLPQAIARCGSNTAIAKVIAWCRELDMPFAIRGGGHSYAGLSTSPGILIDTSLMNGARYDAATGEVTIQAGAKNAGVARALKAQGLIITHGRCPTVGIAGFLLGGGIGFNMRRFGLGCDHLRAAEIVTADGRLRRVSGQQEQDLFWALRGGAGGNFGVSTSFTLSAHPVDERVAVFSIRWQQRSEDLARRFMAEAMRAPDTFSSRLAIRAVRPAQRRPGQDLTLDLLGQFAGTKADLLEILAPVLSIAQPEHLDIQELPYWQGQDFLAEGGEPGFYQERSGFLRGALDERVLDSGLRWLRNWPGTGVGADLRFFQTGGQINRVAPQETAFVHRDSTWLFSIGLEWNARDQATPGALVPARAWQDAFYSEMRQLCGGDAYQNFPDPSLADWRQAYYGANLERLERVKNAVDPYRLFRGEQSI